MDPVSRPADPSQWLYLSFLRRYVIFLNEQRSQLQAEHPDLPFTEITKLLATQWAQLPQERKQVSPFLPSVQRVPVCKGLAAAASSGACGFQSLCPP